MNTETNIPHFRYHTDPLASESIFKEDAYCECCEKMVPYSYIGPIFGSTNSVPDCICPQCISSGDAHLKFGVTFIDEKTQLQSKLLTPEAIEELTQRTPGIAGEEDLTWPCHCQDACALAHVSSSFLDYLFLLPDSFKARFGQLKPHETLKHFKFRCLHCDETLFTGYKVFDSGIITNKNGKLNRNLSRIIEAPEIFIGINGPSDIDAMLKTLKGLFEVFSQGYRSLFDSEMVGVSREKILTSIEELYLGLETRFTQEYRQNSPATAATYTGAVTEEILFCIKGLYFFAFADCIDATDSERLFLADLASNLRDLETEKANLENKNDDISIKRRTTLNKEKWGLLKRAEKLREGRDMPSSRIHLFRFTLDD